MEKIFLAWSSLTAFEMTGVCEKRDEGERNGGEAAVSLPLVPSTKKDVIPNAERNLHPNHYNLIIFHSLHKRNSHRYPKHTDFIAFYRIVPLNILVEGVGKFAVKIE